MKWISVDERLPDYGVRVLAAFKGQFTWVMFVAQKYKGEIREAGYASPTHWMPLPDPPEGV